MSHTLMVASTLRLEAGRPIDAARRIATFARKRGYRLEPGSYFGDRGMVCFVGALATATIAARLNLPDTFSPFRVRAKIYSGALEISGTYRGEDLRAFIADHSDLDIGAICAIEDGFEARHQDRGGDDVWPSQMSTTARFTYHEQFRWSDDAYQRMYQVGYALRLLTLGISTRKRMTR